MTLEHPAASPSAADPFHCITCSDEGIPMRVVDLVGDALASCVPISAPDEAPTDVMIDLVGNVCPADELLVHAGVALTRMPGHATQEAAK